MNDEKQFLNPAGSHWMPYAEAPEAVEPVRDSQKNAEWHKNNDAAAFKAQIKTQDLGAQS